MNICSNWSESAWRTTCGPWIKLNGKTLFKQDDPLQQRAQRHRPELRRRQLGQPPIRLHKAMQRIGAALDHAQAAAEVA